MLVQLLNDPKGIYKLTVFKNGDIFNNFISCAFVIRKILIHKNLINLRIFFCMVLHCFQKSIKIMVIVSPLESKGLKLHVFQHYDIHCNTGKLTLGNDSVLTSLCRSLITLLDTVLMANGSHKIIAISLQRQHTF